MMIQKGAMLDAFLKFPNCSCLKEPIFSFILANADFSYGDLSEAFACENIFDRYSKETGALLLSNQSRAAGALRMFPGSPLIKTTPHPKKATCHSFGSESFKAKQPHVSPEASRVTLSEIMT